ncbi:hypothetical protein ROHU_016807 [Labeo rohita]|uniref:Uncharacterized protein n=1 Tax=Labeo rohita TaxID=84645 RepID=A0A498MLT9_LABRO|nr:hypothetical protein ROHU_007961 [Labeo rohita]RXN31690.1 hypothetical protein ROHU_016807 [Labeo rohita]
MEPAEQGARVKPEARTEPAELISTRAKQMELKATRAEREDLKTTRTDKIIFTAEQMTTRVELKTTKADQAKLEQKAQRG